MLNDFPRLLIGPLFNPGVIGHYFGHPRIRIFMSADTTDASESPYDLLYDIRSDTISGLLARIEPDFQPDFLIWWDGVYQAIPPGIEHCPIPTVLIPGDWNLQLSTLWPYLELFDFVLADKSLLDWMQRGGYEHGLFWPGFSFEPEKHHLLENQDRCYDITFVGNLNHYVQRERGFFLERLGRLSEHYRVAIVGGVYGEEYVRLLNQSKIVFNYTICQTMNMRAYEAPACGALLFIEEDNLEVRDFLEEGVSCVLYNSHNLEEKIAYYLSHEAELRAIAAEGLSQIQRFSYEKQFEWLLHRVTNLSQAKRKKRAYTQVQNLAIQARQIFRSSTPDAPLRAHLEVFNTQVEDSPELCNQKGVYLTHDSFDWGPVGQIELKVPNYVINEAFNCFEKALAGEPNNPIYLFNRAWCFELMGRREEALLAYQSVLNCSEATIAAHWERALPVFPERYTHFEVEWETRFRFTLAGENFNPGPLLRLLKWETCIRLAALSVGNMRQILNWFKQAIITDSSLGEIPYLLALTWLRLDKPKRALSALTVAIRNQPFQHRAWKLKLKLLSESGQFKAALTLVQAVLPITQRVNHLQAEIETYQDWEQLLTLLVLLEKIPERETLREFVAAVRKISRPELAQRFLDYYNQIKPHLHLLWHWFFIPLEFIWQPGLPEPAPDLSPALKDYTGTAPNLKIGTHSAPPSQYLRTWQSETSEDSDQGLITLSQMPSLFPSIPVEHYEIEGLGKFNLLILLGPQITQAEINLLASFRDFAIENPDLSLLLWNRSAGLSSELLLVLNTVFDATPDIQVTLLTELETPAQEVSLLNQVQVLAGCFQPDLNWYYHWALSLSLPLWLQINESDRHDFFDLETAPYVYYDSLNGTQRYLNWAKERDILRNLAEKNKKNATKEKLQRFKCAWHLRQDWIMNQILQGEV
jgi:tetratricopeptide (TPR) repeat protein